MLRNKLLAVAALIAGLLLPAQAMAAYEAFTRADLNLRVGPETTYGVIDVIPQGEPVVVLGCLEDYFWCDVEWFGLRGWVAAGYLVEPGTSVYLPQLAPRLALPIVAFSFHSYHDRHYNDRPWYKKRHGRWRGRDWRRDHRGRDRSRHERRRERRDADRPRRERTERRGRNREIQRSEPRRNVERSRERRPNVERSRRPRSQQRQQRPRAERQQRQRARQRQARPRVQQPQQRQRTSQPRQGKRTETRGRSRAESRGRSRSESRSRSRSESRSRSRSRGNSDERKRKRRR